MFKRRKLRNFLIDPKFQIKFSAYFILSGLAFLGVVVALIFNKLVNLQSLVNRVDVLDVEMQSYINNVLIELTTISLVSFGVFAITSFVYALIVSHRIAGPSVAICRFIDQMKEGNYDKKGNKLRKYDELQVIMNKLHELSDNLQERHGSVSTSSANKEA